MRIVLDTNVVVSGLLSDTSVPAQVLDLCISGDVLLVVDGRIMREYEDVLTRYRLILGEAHPGAESASRGVRADCDIDPMPL